MKNITIYLSALMIVFNICGAFAQETATGGKPKRKITTMEALILGDRYLNGINTEVDYAKALKIYRVLARKGNAEGLNRLAGMYRQGFGTEQNPDSARYYYQMASDRGSGKASYNLMNMYRMGEGVEQNYDSAIYYARIAYEQNYVKQAAFSLGYFYMKGQGVEQDYAKALEYFEKGAVNGSGICTYYVGFFYVGGFGVEQDIDKGMQYMDKAVSLGSDAAVSFITENRVEKYRPSSLRSTKRSDAPFRRKRNTAERELSGMWEGKLMRYDWSGKRVLEEKPLSLQLDFRDGQLSGTWVQDDSVAIRVTGHLEDSLWVFDQMHYLDARIERPWEIRSGAFQIRSADGADTMEGNVEQYSSATKEKSSPVALALIRTAKGEDMEELNRTRNTLQVSPNPFDNELTISFSIAKGQNINLRVHDVEGHTVHNSTTYYDEGEHRHSLRLQVPTGTYSVSIKGETVNLTSLVIKK